MASGHGIKLRKYVSALASAVRTVMPLLALLTAANASAQSDTTADSVPTPWTRKVVKEINAVLDTRDRMRKLRYDTAYMAKPSQRWTVKLRANISGNALNTHGTIDDINLRSRLRADMKITIGASVSYRGLSVGFALNPAKLSGRNKDLELNLNAYGNRVGGDVVMVATKTYKGTALVNGTDYDIAAGAVSMKMLTATGYYAFNHRRFSIPAAFTQSQVQRRSCGSWLAGLSFMAAGITTAAGAVPGTEGSNLWFVSAALGGGYGYNFVIGSQWLIHLSAVPQLMIITHGKFKAGDTSLQAPFRFPSLTNVGRIAVVRHFGNRFIGLSSVINMFYIGDRDQLLIENVKWRARLFYGFRF